MSEPLVSILMPLFNEERFLEPALDSLPAQEFGDFELLVSSNRATDGTRNVVQRLRFAVTGSVETKLINAVAPRTLFPWASPRSRRYHLHGKP